MAEFTPEPVVEFTPEPVVEFTPVPITTEPEEETSTFSDVAQGVGAGLIGLPQGIAETGAAVIDSIADTNTSRAVTKGFESANFSIFKISPDLTLYCFPPVCITAYDIVFIVKICNGNIVRAYI